jgi:hypothetical protein
LSEESLASRQGSFLSRKGSLASRGQRLTSGEGIRLLRRLVERTLLRCDGS